MPPDMESPQFVQTSLAGAISLGLERGRFMPNTTCTCLNLLLMYDGGCRASCDYCGLSRNARAAGTKTFIRVKWPAYSMTDILEKMQRAKHPFTRVCVSMITHDRALADACAVVRQVRKSTDLPVSGLLSPTVMAGRCDLQKIRAAGADHAGIAIDAATKELFERHRGSGVGGPHRWESYWQSVVDSVEVFGRYNAGIHLMVGLGETDRQMVDAISRAYRLGAMTHLFSFFPESGSFLQHHPQPSLAKYRRIQVARYLINEGITDGDGMRFSSEGRIIDFGLDIAPYLQRGEVFMTSGCPDSKGRLACNRPFGNERASEPIRNYPYRPGPGEIRRVLAQIWDDDLVENVDHRGDGETS